MARLHDVFRITTSWRQAGQECRTTFHYRAVQNSADANTPGELSQLILDWTSRYLNAWLDDAEPGIVVDDTIMTQVEGEGPPYFSTIDHTLIGAGNGDALPGFVSLPIYCNTGLSGRTRRGRIHIGGWHEDNQSEGTLTAAGTSWIDGIVTGLENLITDAASFRNYRPCVWSRTEFERAILTGGMDYLDAVVHASPLITGFSAGSVLGTLYSRRIGIGI